ncbi:MAG: CoA transferase [Pseudohongiellaceae bacterium]
MTDDASEPLLADIRVVEVATLVFGPSAGVILSDFGADVIKVEPPVIGDLNRRYHTLPGMPESELAYTFEVDNRNKKSIAIDIRSEQGYAVFRKLIEGADVFLSNYRLGALERLKIGYEDLKAINPEMIYAIGTGYGEEGDERDKPGYDSVCYWTRSGIEGHVFPVGGWLGAFPFGAGDHPSGTTLFAAIMTGLYQRQKTGRGCKVSTSLLATGAWANATLLQAQLCNARFKEKRPRDRAHNYAYLHYRCSDGRLIRLGIVNAGKDWVPFCRAVDHPELADDPRFATAENRADNMEQLLAVLDVAFAGRDVDFWRERLGSCDIPFAVVPTYEEAANDLQKADNDIVIPLEHPRFGSIRTVNSPFAVSGCPKIPPGSAPGLGEHTRDVLESLGYDDAAIDAMIGDGVVAKGADN